MSMLEWARKEIELRKTFEGQGLKEGEFDYGGSCCDSALKAFESLMEDGHSGASIHITKAILNRLIDGKPIMPIEDASDIWNEVSYDKETKTTMFQNKRMSSLFKYVDENGVNKYTDVNRYYAYTTSNPQFSYSSGLINRIIDEMFPIEMPYMPADKSIAVATKEYLTDKKNGSYDTVAVLHATLPDGTVATINRYFKEGNRREWVEIDKNEYNVRVMMDSVLKGKLKV